MLLNVFIFGRGILVSHGFFLEGDPCSSLFFALGG